ncbi:MAG: archease [Candidatus Heimdallarchaeota archaeon]
MKEAGFEFKGHTADIKVRSWGRTLEEAFAQTALGLMAIMSPDLKRISSTIQKSIEITSEDIYALLFDFLSEFLYLFDVDGLIFGDIIVNIMKKEHNEYYLQAIIKGEKFDRHKHKIGTEVKAVTYSFMNIKEKKNKVEIDIIFDI